MLVVANLPSPLSRLFREEMETAKVNEKEKEREASRLAEEVKRLEKEKADENELLKMKVKLLEANEEKLKAEKLAKEKEAELLKVEMTNRVEKLQQLNLGKLDPTRLP